MSLMEGGNISAYLIDANNLQDYLTIVSETISGMQLINVVLNGLFRLYKMIIQGITYLLSPKFDNVVSKILTVS